jgi:predicted YcjX-like family ATPase
MESLSYRIEELEKLVKEHLIDKAPTKESQTEKTEPVSMAAVDGDEEDSVDSDEEELPKLDGAPIDDEPKPTHKFTNKKNTVGNSQNTFLSKLYN